MADRTTLDAQGLAVAFGALRAVDGVDLEVAEGQCVGVVGANGAGKSTLLNLLSGAVQPDAGTVTVVENGRSHRLDGAPGRARARLGIVRMFQTARLVPDLSARENVELGVPAPRGAWLEALGLPTSRRRAGARRRAAEDALARVGLADRAGMRAGELSLGQQRLVEMARSLASGARILLLDEPFSGLSRTAREVVASLVANLRDDGVGVLLVEHDLAQVRLLADRVVVLDAGRVLAAGPVEETLADPEVVRRYIGDIELEIGGGLDDARPSRPPVAAPTPVSAPPDLHADRTAVLEVRDLRVFYGAVPAVDGVELTVAAGDGLGIVGPNGAGKSTVLRGVAGLLTATGSVRLAGERLDGTATPHRFRHGLGFVPQTLTAVVDLSVEENLRLGWLAGSRAQSFAEAMERVGDLFGEIADRRKDPAGALSGGQRQMLAIARALVAGPRVVLLDEPTAGLAPVLVAPFADALARLRADGVAVVVVEHNLGLVRATCSTILGLRAGAPVWSGPTERFDGAAAHEVFLAATAPARTGPSLIEEEHLSS